MRGLRPIQMYCKLYDREIVSRHTHEAHVSPSSCLFPALGDEDGQMFRY